MTGIETAIREKKIIEFDYGGYHRIAEPHLYGKKDGKHQVLVYQIAGGSSSRGIPDWRRVEMNKVSNLIMTERRFQGARPYPSGKHSSFDIQYAIVT